MSNSLAKSLKSPQRTHLNAASPPRVRRAPQTQSHSNVAVTAVRLSVRPSVARPQSQPLSLSHLKIGENGWCKYELVLRKITDHRGPRRPAAAGPVLRGCCRTVRPTIRSYFSLQTLYTYPENFRAYKALIAAQYSGAKVTVAADFVFGETNKSEAFLQKFPTGKVSTNCPVRPPKPPHLSCITGFVVVVVSNFRPFAGAHSHKHAEFPGYVRLADVYAFLSTHFVWCIPPPESIRRERIEFLSTCLVCLCVGVFNDLDIQPSQTKRTRLQQINTALDLPTFPCRSLKPAGTAAASLGARLKSSIFW